MERLVEILIYFATELSKKRQIDELDVKFLLNKGYSKSEISIALSWIFERLEDGKSTLFQNMQSEGKSFRYLHEAERDLFTPDGWQELTQLYSLGLLSLELLELFIDRAMMMGLRNIDSEQVKKFVGNLLFNSAGNDGFYGLARDEIIN
ncbi:MAG: hypothetical protein CH6_0169 [Candidatus Kapaibacterium sp.]|jgi:uncharacterized protein Smg (DUF494 family)|nr:MAG: hypothetical protein CH6_0169 [Candidatus Kapabacteria bacterium]ROL56006.1 MAG: DUF494 family protein [Bacteroidetes/Chlorobi group bacterium Naka2016]